MTRKQDDDRYQLVWLGLHYLEVEKHLSTVESNSVICSSAPLRPNILPPSDQCSLSKEQIYKSLGFLRKLFAQSKTDVRSPVADVERQLEELLQNPSSLISGHGLASAEPTLGSEQQAQNATEEAPFEMAIPQVLVNGKPSASLIEDLTPTQAVNEAPDATEPRDIRWSVVVLASTHNYQAKERRTRNKLKLMFELPGVTSGKQCDMDLNEVILYCLINQVDSVVNNGF